MRISTPRRTVLWALACVWIIVGWHGAAALPQGPGGIDRSTVLQAFAEQTERYVRLRARFDGPLPAFDARRDSWSLMLTRRYLASANRTARSSAHQGDIFTPPVAQLFRGLIADAVYDVDIEGLVDEEFEAAGFAVDVVVNEPVLSWARQDVPEPLLRRLPTLPDAIAYRMAGGTLVLWDTHAQIVIDALPDAFLVQ